MLEHMDDLTSGILIDAIIDCDLIVLHGRNFDVKTFLRFSTFFFRRCVVASCAYVYHMI